MMTKKDFELIAEILRESRPASGYERNLLAWNLIAKRFADRLKNTNPAFNEEKFLKAARG